MKYFYILLSGVFVGWITGLSVSPVVHIVLTSMMALVSAVVAAVCGVEVKSTAEAAPDTAGAQPGKLQQLLAALAKPGEPEKPLVSPAPLVFLLLGISIGGPIGIIARTNEWFGIQPRDAVKRWQGLGLTDREIAGHMLDDVYGKQKAEEKPKTETPAAGNVQTTGSIHGPGFYNGIGPSTADSLNNAINTTQRRNALIESGDAQLMKFEKDCSGSVDSCFDAAVKDVIWPK